MKQKKVFLLVLAPLLYGGCGIFGELDWGALLGGGLKITYNLNGGEGTAPQDSNTYSKGTRVTAQIAPVNAAPPEGATAFYGWSTAPDGYGEFHAAESAFTLMESTKLYALWEGDGTNPDHPKLGSTKDDLLAIGQEENFALVADIDDMDTTLFPSDHAAFTGIFDGRGHTITLNVNKATTYQTQIMYAGLFNFVYGTAIIKNVHVTGSISLSNSASHVYAGGLVGIAMTGSDVQIINCISSVNITHNAPQVDSYLIIGGILGAFYGTVSIKHCYAMGSIFSDVTNSLANKPTNVYVGGIVGRETGGSNGALTLEKSVSLEQRMGWTTAGTITNLTTKSVRLIAGGDVFAVISGNYGVSGTGKIRQNTSEEVLQTPNEVLDGTTVTAADARDDSWWRETAGWEEVWGGENPTTDKPWEWDREAGRPRLHKFN